MLDQGRPALLRLRRASSASCPSYQTHHAGGRSDQPFLDRRRPLVKPLVMETPKASCGPFRCGVRHWSDQNRGRAAQRVDCGGHLPDGRRSANSGIDIPQHHSLAAASVVPPGSGTADPEDSSRWHRNPSWVLSKRCDRASQPGYWPVHSAMWRVCEATRARQQCQRHTRKPQ